MFADGVFPNQEMMDYYLEDMEGLDDDEYSDMEEQMLSQFGWVNGTQGKSWQDLADEDNGPKWVYTGTQNQKETWAACKEVSISQTI